MVFVEVKWCQSLSTVVLLPLIAIPPADEGVLLLRILKRGINVDEDDNQKVEHSANNP